MVTFLQHPLGLRNGHFVAHFGPFIWAIHCEQIPFRIYHQSKPINCLEGCFFCLVIFIYLYLCLFCKDLSLDIVICFTWISACLYVWFSEYACVRDPPNLGFIFRCLRPPGGHPPPPWRFAYRGANPLYFLEFLGWPQNHHFSGFQFFFFFILPSERLYGPFIFSSIL